MVDPRSIGSSAKKQSTTRNEGIKLRCLVAGSSCALSDQVTSSHLCCPCLPLFLKGTELDYHFFYSFKNIWFHLTEEKKAGKKHCLAVFWTRDLVGFYPAFITDSPELESKVANPHEDPIGLVSEIFSNL